MRKIRIAQAVGAVAMVAGGLLSTGTATAAARAPRFYLDCEVGCKPVPNLHRPTQLNIWLNGGGTFRDQQFRAIDYGCADVITVFGNHVGTDCDY